MAATGIVTRKTYLQKNPEILENIMKALIEAEHYMMSPGGKAQSIKTIMSHLKLTEIAVAEEGHADAIKDFDPKPVPSLEGLKNMQRLLAMQNPRLADVNAASLVDLTLMRKLEDSGFFTQLQTRYRE
jgi:ABC-type nitrate/sulfonate/bicarbonate transport system substrate-binding protein